MVPLIIANRFHAAASLVASQARCLLCVMPNVLVVVTRLHLVLSKVFTWSTSVQGDNNGYLAIHKLSASEDACFGRLRKHSLIVTCNNRQRSIVVHLDPNSPNKY